MGETRRNLFKKSILSIFGTMSGFALVGAAARAEEVETIAPILVRAKSGLYLLEPGEGGEMKAWQVDVGRTALPPNLNAYTIASQRGVSLKKVTDADLVVQNSTTIKIRNGVVSSHEIKSLKVSCACWNEIELSEFAWIEVPGAPHTDK